MKTTMKFLVMVLVAMGLAMHAQALTIAYEGDYVASGDDTSNAQINNLIAAYLEECEDLDEAYKQNTGENTDSGSASGWYTTTFNNSPTDPSGATIVWDGGDYIDSAEVYLLVKDGNQGSDGVSPFSWYLYDISGWDGQETINLTGFWPGRGSISHVSLYTCGGPGTNVPDGGVTAMLLGAAMLGLGGLKRLVRR